MFQRKTVKEKCKLTFQKKYGKNITCYSKTKMWKDLQVQYYIEKYGINNFIEKTINNNSKKSIYYKNVWSYSISQINKFGPSNFGYNYKDIKTKNKKIEIYKNKLAIDHKYSIIRGFINNVDPKIIGSIHNIEILTVSENCTKGSKCSIKLKDLRKLYENKKNK